MEARWNSSPVICIGETMAQLSAVPPSDLQHAARLSFDVAGAESTVSLYLSHLGHRAEWISRVGDDPFGRRIVDVLRSGGVGVQHVAIDAASPTGVYFKDPGADGTTVYYYRRGSAAAHMTPDSIPAGVVDGARLVHVTGITPALSPTTRLMTDAVFERARAADVDISFDVNHRAKLWKDRDAASELLALAKAADIVFVGLDEAEALWGTPSPEDVRRLLPEARELVVKEGSVGATVFTVEAEVFEPADQVEVVEPVGAGDSFAAGYLHGMLTGVALDERLRLGHRLAAAVLSVTTDFVVPEESHRVAEH